MANPLTGDFEAVLQVSGSTVNRLLASMHQNAWSKPSLPSFPHGVWIRVGDPNPIDGMRGNIRGQVSVPRIDLIHGTSDRFWLDVAIRARYTPDPGSVPIPEFIHGIIRAQYRIDNIDRTCTGWGKIAADYLWIRVIRDTVSFTGTAVDDPGMLAVAPPIIDAATADERITRLARFLLSRRFKAAPHKVTSARFRRGSMRSLNVGTNRSLVAVPIGITGDPPPGDIESIDQDILDKRDVGIAVSKDFILRRIQEKLDKEKATFSTTFVAESKGAILGVTVATVTINYGVTILDAKAQWLGALPPILGVPISGGLVSVWIRLAARTQKSRFNFDCDVSQSVLITFDPSGEKFSAVPFGEPVVIFLGLVGAIIELQAKPEMQSEVADVVKDAIKGIAGNTTLKYRKQDLIDQLKTMDDGANVIFDEAVFTGDGVMVRGTISLSPRSAPVNAFATSAAKDGYDAFDSWIPGGRIDSFLWSWKWFNSAGKPGSESETDRYVLRRPMATGQGRFGAMLGLKRPLPGLDGMGQMCLVLKGVHVHSVTGELVEVYSARRCKRFGFEVRIPGVDRVFLREWVPGPRDPIGPVAERGIHQVNGPDARGHGANTLVVRIGDRWNREVARSLREALANSARRDAGLVVLVLFSDGMLVHSETEWLSEVEQLAAELEAPLVVNEDVRGSWSKALGMNARGDGEEIVQWRLLTPTGGVSWARNGSLDSQDIAEALDYYLFPSPTADLARLTRGLAIGSRLSPDVFESDVIGRLAEREDECPPPPVGYVGIEASVSFVAKGSTSPDAVRSLMSRGEGAGVERLNVLVLEGATADEVDKLRQSLPEGVTVIPDPDGSISRRFGVRVWPSSVVIDESGMVSGFEPGFETDSSEQAGTRKP